MTTTVTILLTFIISMALFLPFTIHKIEEELEIFLFVLGVAAVSVVGAWSWPLIGHTLKEPIAISLAVLVTGLLFRKYKKYLVHSVEFLEKKIGVKKTIVLVIFILSLMSSLITAIIAALILCEIASTLRLTRRDTIHVIVMGCFAIGMGAVLTPLGEPLSTIVTSKLSHPPHNAGFFYLFSLLWEFVIPGVIFFSFMAGRIKDQQKKTETWFDHESTKDIALRAGKVFLFVAALVLFGTGLTPLAEVTIMRLPISVLYWANSISAILDNATLAAAEIIPSMTRAQIEFMLMALIISGGFLVPGNIPNIICASKFKIKSKEWAKKALPTGLATMLVYFAILSLTKNVVLQ